MNRTVDVYTSLPKNAGQGEREEVLVGRAFFSVSRRGVATTFRYERGYLTHKGRFPLDPALPLFDGMHAIADGLPYSFTDCAPDREPPPQRVVLVGEVAALEEQHPVVRIEQHDTDGDTGRRHAASLSPQLGAMDDGR